MQRKGWERLPHQLQPDPPPPARCSPKQGDPGGQQQGTAPGGHLITHFLWVGRVTRALCITDSGHQ